MKSTIIEKKINIKGRRPYKVMVESYQSAMEVAEDCKTRTITSSMFDDQSKREFDSWQGVKSYSEALDLLSNGYQPTVEKLKSAMKGLRQGNGKRISFKNDIVGYNPVVPLALQGVPKNMVNMIMKPIKCKVIDIYFDMTCSASTGSDKIIENGQKVLGAVLELEKQGYKFNIYAVQGYSNSESADILTVKVKSSSQPLDLKRISFPLTHTAFFRVIGFDWYSKTPKGTYRSSYGHALGHEFNNEQLEQFSKQVFGDSAVYISGTNIKYQGQDYIMEVLKDAGSKKKTRR